MDIIASCLSLGQRNVRAKAPRCPRGRVGLDCVTSGILTAYGSLPTLINSYSLRTEGIKRALTQPLIHRSLSSDSAHCLLSEASI